MPYIEWQNISTVMTDADAAMIMSAVIAQVNQDFTRYWDCNGLWLRFVLKTGKMNPAHWQFVIADTSDVAGAAGYHELGSGGGPIGFAFAKTTLDAGMKPSVTISHEILEMLADPYIDQTAQWADNPSPLFLAYEVGDPVEDDQFAQMKNGIELSDFVLPSFFIPGSQGPWDMMGHCAGPWNPAIMLPGSYQATWTPAAGWQQVFPASKVSSELERIHGIRGEGRAAIVNPHSRRVRRLKKREERRRSTR